MDKTEAAISHGKNISEEAENILFGGPVYSVLVKEIERLRIVSYHAEQAGFSAVVQTCRPIFNCTACGHLNRPSESKDKSAGDIESKP